MTTAPVPTIPPKGVTLKDLARYAKLTEGLKALTAEKDLLNAKLKDAYATAKIVKAILVYPSAAGNFIVTIDAAYNVDSETMTEDFPIEERPDFYTAKIDPKKMPPAIVSTYRTIPVPKLSVKKA